MPLLNPTISKEKIKALKIAVLFFFLVELTLGFYGIAFREEKTIALFMSLVAIVMVVVVLFFIWKINFMKHEV